MFYSYIGFDLFDSKKTNRSHLELPRGKSVLSSYIGFDLFDSKKTSN